jgi:non-ribosomal peptide synthetase component E (peptide arylation enzyme)
MTSIPRLLVSPAARLARTRGLCSSTPATVVAAVAAAPRANTAILAPQQGIAWTYEELDTKARCLASGLGESGVSTPRRPSFPITAFPFPLAR